jgi:HD-GYP domain-containing protein (c-di-GMP phosphodiesterase class II)
MQLVHAPIPNSDVEGFLDHRDLVPVGIVALMPPTSIHVNLHFWDGNADQPLRLYSSASAPPTPHDLRRLMGRGVTKLYTSKQELADMHEQFRDLLQSGVEIPPAVHLEIIRETVKTDLARAWKSVQVSELVTQTSRLTHMILDVCRPETHVAALMMALQAHDGDTFTHVTNVCAYVVLLARELGVSDDGLLTALGHAALLHDLGKRSIQKDLLKKTNVLSQSERLIIAEHPRLGFLELCNATDLDRDQLLMVYHHHERVDGTGYPVGLVGEEIGWTARLCTVVDVFDALTGKRPYRRPITAEESLAVLERGAGTQFDEEYVRCWSSMVRPMPN